MSYTKIKIYCCKVCGDKPCMVGLAIDDQYIVVNRYDIDSCDKDYFKSEPFKRIYKTNSDFFDSYAQELLKSSDLNMYYYGA